MAAIAPLAGATSSIPWLSLAVFVPAGGALLLACLPRRFRALIQGVALLTSLVVLVIAAEILALFKSGVGGFQLVVDHSWIAPLGISWNLGVDGISLFLLVMTALLFPITLIGAGERENLKSFAVWALLLEAACVGSFLSLDLLLFFLFFEMTLVPIYFLIGGWGHERRSPAATKFFIYTFLASAFLLVGIVALVALHASQSGVTTFSVVALARTSAPVGDRGGAPLLGLHHRLRREGAGLPLPHLVARCLRGGAALRLDPVGGGDGQARHLRDRAL